jgi:hypothetical protein
LAPIDRIKSDFGFGSKAALTIPKSDLRFTLESWLNSDIAPCLKGAINDQSDCSNLRRFIDASSGPSLSYDEARRIAANIDVWSAMRRNSDVRFRAATGPTRLMSVSAALNN